MLPLTLTREASLCHGQKSMQSHKWSTCSELTVVCSAGLSISPSPSPSPLPKPGLREHSRMEFGKRRSQQTENSAVKYCPLGLEQPSTHKLTAAMAASSRASHDRSTLQQATLTGLSGPQTSQIRIMVTIKSREDVNTTRNAQGVHTIWIHCAHFEIVSKYIKYMKDTLVFKIKVLLYFLFVRVYGWTCVQCMHTCT